MSIRPEVDVYEPIMKSNAEKLHCSTGAQEKLMLINNIKI